MTTRPRYITAAQIRRAGACRGKQRLFEAIAGKNGRIRITEDTALALAGVFPMYWAVAQLLSTKQRDVYSRQKEQELVRASATEMPYDTATKTLMDNGVTNDGSARYYELKNLVDEALARRLRVAKAYAFVFAYNSPKK